jgi:hypothetical protein
MVLTVKEFEEWRNSFFRNPLDSKDSQMLGKIKQVIESYIELKQQHDDLLNHMKETQEKAGKFDIIVRNFKLNDNAKELIR